MKRNGLICVFVAEAVICVLLHILQASFTGVFSAAMAFPFEQIGLGLRLLSLSGTVGNIVAIVLYIAICLLPAVLIFFLRKMRKLHIEDGLIALLSIVLFAVIYLMINPGYIANLTRGAEGLPIGKAMLGGTVYSILCGYVVLRVLRLFCIGSTDKLIRYMSRMLGVLGVFFVYLIFGACLDGLFESVQTLRAGNTGNVQLLTASYFFLILQYVVDAMPYAWNIVIVFSALGLLYEMLTDRFSIETVTSARNMSRLCVSALVVTVLSNIGFNLLQLLFARSLMVMQGSLQIPVLAIAFVLLALLLTRLVMENKQLKDDNDLFI